MTDPIYYIIKEVGTGRVYWKKTNKFEDPTYVGLQHCLMTKENAMVDLRFLIDHMGKSCYIEESKNQWVIEMSVIS
jgi:hypothetical protein